VALALSRTPRASVALTGKELQQRLVEAVALVEVGRLPASYGRPTTMY
jgi:hypothetical protein